MAVTIRAAEKRDAGEITRLVRELTAAWFEEPPIDEAFVLKYLDAPDCGALLAEVDGRVSGLLSYTVRLNLSHAAETALIEELVVSAEARGTGVGGVLLEAFIERMQARGCAEVSVSTLPENTAAAQFYRRHGLTDEAVFLERHFE